MKELIIKIVIVAIIAAMSVAATYFVFEVVSKAGIPLWVKYMLLR